MQSAPTAAAASSGRSRPTWAPTIGLRAALGEFTALVSRSRLLPRLDPHARDPDLRAAAAQAQPCGPTVLPLVDHPARPGWESEHALPEAVTAEGHPNPVDMAGAGVRCGW